MSRMAVVVQSSGGLRMFNHTCHLDFISLSWQTKGKPAVELTSLLCIFLLSVNPICSICSPYADSVFAARGPGGGAG